jgi:hypothetical protein
LRLIAGFSDGLVPSAEQDLAQWEGISLFAALKRWSVSGGWQCSGIVFDAAEPPTGASRPFCSPDGWTAGVGFRAVPHPRGTVSPFLQAGTGLHRYDGRGIVTPQVAGRAGLVLTTSAGLSVDIGAELQWMAGFEWSGARYPSETVGAWQIGLGFPTN